MGSRPSALLDVAGDDGHVAVVYDREVIKDRDIQRRVVRPEEMRDAANALRAEARPDAEGRRRIKGSSDYRSIAILEISDVLQSHESAHPAETWCLERVGRWKSGPGTLTDTQRQHRHATYRDDGEA